MYMLLMGDLDKSTLEKLVDVFKEGKNIDQIKESLSNTMLILRNGEKEASLSNTNPPSKYHGGDPLTGESKDEQGKDFIEKKKNSRQKASPPPVTIEVTEPMEVWATDQGISVDLETETDIMLDHYRSKGDTRVDWMAVWKNWMRRAETYSQQRKGNGNYKSQADKAADNITAAWEQAEDNGGADEACGKIPRLWAVPND